MDRNQEKLLDEITSLNADDLSIEELERRLEMNTAAMEAEGGCTIFGCGTFTPPSMGDCWWFSCENFRRGTQVEMIES